MNIQWAIWNPNCIWDVQEWHLPFCIAADIAEYELQKNVGIYPSLDRINKSKQPIESRVVFDVIRRYWADEISICVAFNLLVRKGIKPAAALYFLDPMPGRNANNVSFTEMLFRLPKDKFEAMTRMLYWDQAIRNYQSYFK